MRPHRSAATGRPLSPGPSTQPAQNPRHHKKQRPGSKEPGRCPSMRSRAFFLLFFLIAARRQLNITTSSRGASAGSTARAVSTGPTAPGACPW